MKKRSKLPIISLLALLLVLSLGGGFFAGKALYDGDEISKIVQKFGLSSGPGEPSGAPADSVAESVIEISPLPENTDGGYETTYIYEKVNPSVVSITVYSNQSIAALGSGTGIVMSADGYIITNAHVVNGGTSVNVTFSDETDANGTIIGMDTTTDLAVVKVDRTDLTPAEFGDSSALKVGERIVAIGNAGGLSSTMTQGIVSGLDRDLGEGARSLKLIQVDAAINPGNSGGPLINRFGQVIGINSSKIASVDYEGIGFSIPINEAKPILESIISHGYVTGRAVLGVSVVELNSSNGPINGLPSEGVCIMEFTADSDLPGQGVQLRDVIVEANGVDIVTTDDLLTELDKYSPGDTFNLVVYRATTRKTYSVDVKLIESVG
ncbi:MAG: trypsin-like peptidase domain-containing protein [Oscillospiraceae bacterium]|nr:trypsin-like peptidase domain-containing protein [Oscillospiraceae bacterium]